jgi:hypothetical protein
MLAGAPSASDSKSSASYPGIGVELSVSCPQDGTPQLLTIRNLSPAPLDVAKVSSLLNPLDEEPFTPTELKILPGITQQLQFGGADGDVPSAIWLINVPIFDAAMNEGARVELRNGQVYFACCDGTGLCYGAGQKPATVVVAARKRRGHRRKRRRQRRLGRD